MPHISLEDHLPGITGLLEYSQASALPIRELTQLLLRGPSSLSELDRELIATVVSQGNQCVFCTTAHAAAADLLAGDSQLTQQVRENVECAAVSPKLKALLVIADLVRQGGKFVHEAAIKQAKEAGASDLEIHDTVLIASLFCLYNRYVDGLATSLPAESSYYLQLADRIVHHGYTRLPQGYDHLKKS